ncbi:DUF2793 domain-containing protein [Cognatishimia sp. F0-27]|uniref:DUF2793 domain-containing protein n=1 Tax=Cognatishimia sp. F0-27 TaxID=2816855 RepID=UPI001D0BFDC9|nr:DUF2793 domain-containing protein [Cognatishimia sp. F0-27]MCC1494746.1 DUF2793 domain-containing protein [Cognatishimia sp. F0-27]
MSDLSPILSMPFILPSQAQKHVTHNEALRILDLAVQLSVADADRTEPPASPAEGARHIVASPATGEWAGHEGALAQFSASEGWVFTTTLPGWRAWNAAEARMIVWDGTGWAGVRGETQEVDLVGVNATADPVNRLCVSAPATLLSHEGDGHQLKINKAATGDTASLLFQTGWSGRAEMGTAGDDAFSIKVSADGAAWVTALSLDPVTGHATGDAVQQSAVDVTPGRLARADLVYGPGNLLGPVSEAGGVPTGAVIERGSGVSGEFVRFADGALICCHNGASRESELAYGQIFRSTAANWTFPASFIAPPIVSGQVVDGEGWVAISASTTTNATAYRYSVLSESADCTLRFLAVGRWA